MKSWVVPAGAGDQRVDRFLVEVLRDVSRATVQRWIREGRVELDGRICKPKDKVWPGVTLRVRPGEPPSSLAEPDASVIVPIVYQDEHLVVVDKPAGLVVHPGKGNPTGTMVNGLLALPGFGRPPSDAGDPEGPMRPGVVHRIDKDTSGLLVVAKDGPTREGLKEQFAAHSARRSYVALTLGVPREGWIRTAHARHPTRRLRFTSLSDSGRSAATHVEVAQRFGALAAQVRCRLETGRTHQIRVHLAEQSRTPLLADALYGRSSQDTRLRDIAARLGRQALHAAELGFRHPITNEDVHFESVLPADMARAVDELNALFAADG